MDHEERRPLVSGGDDGGESRGTNSERPSSSATAADTTTKTTTASDHRLLPLLLVFLFALWAYWFNCFMQVAAQRREDDPNPLDFQLRKHHHGEHKPLPEPLPQADALYRILPYVHYWLVNDMLVGVLMLLLVLKFAFISSVSRVLIAKRYLLIQGMLFALRGVSVYLTGMSLPKTVRLAQSTSCKSDISDELPAALEAWFVMAGVHRTCADLLFSGHSAFYMLAFLLVWTYGKGEEWVALLRLRAKHRRKNKHESTDEHARESGETFQGASAHGPSSDVENPPSQVVLVTAIEASPSSLVPILLTDEQRKQNEHDEIARAHPFLIPELNAAGDPNTMSLSSLFVLLYASCGWFFLISTHFHYSVDVFVGVIVVLATFAAYHGVLKTMHERRAGCFKSAVTWLEGMPKVGEYAIEESEDERHSQARMQRKHFEQLPQVPEEEATHDNDLHTYVVYSLTQNRYLLKRVHELADLDGVRRKDAKPIAHGPKSMAKNAASSNALPPHLARFQSGLSMLSSPPAVHRSQSAIRAEDEAFAKQEAESQYEAFGIEHSPLTASDKEDQRATKNKEHEEKKTRQA